MYPAWCSNLHGIYSIVAVVCQFFCHSGGCHTESSFVVAREGRDKVVTFPSPKIIIYSDSNHLFKSVCTGHPAGSKTIYSCSNHQLPKTKLEMLQTRCCYPCSLQLQRINVHLHVHSAQLLPRPNYVMPHLRQRGNGCDDLSGKITHDTTAAKIPAPAVRRNHCSHRNGIVQCKNRITCAASLTRQETKHHDSDGGATSRSTDDALTVLDRADNTSTMSPMTIII